MPSDAGPRDWQVWHGQYDVPHSRLARRLRVVQQRLREAIDRQPGAIHIVSMCAGQGRDVVGVLAAHPRRDEVSAVLVELEPRNVANAREAATAAELSRVEVREADAALTDCYAGAVPAEIVLACGVFGNIPDEEIRRTIAWLPRMCAPGATVLWTRGAEPDRDIRTLVRGWFTQSGFEELAYDGAPETFGVGAARLVTAPPPFEPGVRLFTFFR